MKRIILFITLIMISLATFITSSKSMYALNTKIENETITFNVKKENSIVGNKYKTDNYKLALLLENYYDHQFRLGIEQINVELKINDDELIYPGFYSIQDDSISLYYNYFEFGTMQDAQIIFKYNSKEIEIIGGPTGYNYVGKWDMVIPKVIYNDINELPETNNKLGIVNFVVEENRLITNIDYDGHNYKFTRNFIEKTDMSLFDTNEAYYINENGSNPQIIINHSNNDYLIDLLENPKEPPAFVPHTIWNLETNELFTKEKYATNVYVDVNKQGVMIAYVYIDEYIIDDIVSATLKWTSRTKTERLFGWFGGLFNSYSEWNSYQATFKNDEYLNYKDLTFSWQNRIPGWNNVRGIFQNLKTFNMPRIQSVDFDNSQKEYDISKEMIENYFIQANPDFKKLKKNPRYKLWAFAIEPNAVNEVNLMWSTIFGSVINQYTEFYNDPNNPSDPNNLQIINIDYITNGKLYTADGNDMEKIITLTPELIPDQPKTDDNKIKIIASIIVIIILLSAINTKAFRSPKAAINFVIGLAIISIILFIIYMLLTKGNIILLVL